ncbi:hypothetical protein NDU88_008454 [Pleurodeles waltl]|uniref:Uncharacterized protein n=1 Tax=Pleurodeles waltl TaxID=8319 RepID=A0AAV7RW52_PLEWA|nr:hypothetical protein NDU88_008454 [Pleurodeles waltl]
MDLGGLPLSSVAQGQIREVQQKDDAWWNDAMFDSSAGGNVAHRVVEDDEEELVLDYGKEELEEVELVKGAE